VKYFIDCGAHCGCSRRFWYKYIDKKKEFEVISFEADPSFKELCPELISKAVWTHDGTIEFNKFALSGGSSVNDYRAEQLEKQDAYKDTCEKIKVPCLDIDAWIKNSFGRHDYIVLKLDIECAEYQILPHMIENGSIDYINKLYIEWHEKAKCGMCAKKRVWIEKELVKRKIPISNGS